MLGIFELVSGKVIMSKYEILIGEDNGNQHYLLLNPIVLIPMQSPDGREGMKAGNWIGKEVEVYPHGVVAINMTDIDKNLENMYIQATTGIQVTAGNKSNVVSPIR